VYSANLGTPPVLQKILLMKCWSTNTETFVDDPWFKHISTYALTGKGW